MKKNFVKSHLPLILIILVALFLRFYEFGLIEFKHDEVHFLWTAKNAIEKNEYPLLGSGASIKVSNPAISEYIVIMFSFISRSPFFITAVITCLNILAIILCYFFLKKHFSERIAIIACLLFATSPYAIIYSRKIWQPNILPFLVISFMFCFYNLVFNKDKKYTILSVVLLALIAQIHMSGWFLLPFLFLICFFSFKLKKGMSFFLIGLGLAALTFLPYAHYELTHDFKNLHAFSEYGKKEGKLSFDFIKFSANTATISGFKYYLGKSYDGFKFVNIPLLNFLSVLSYLLGFILVITKINKKNFFILLWILLPIAFFLFPKSPIHPHYLIITYPAQWIVMSFFFDRAMSIKNLKHVTQILLLVIILYHSFFSISLYNYIDEAKRINGDYGVPLKYKLEELTNANETVQKTLLTKSEYLYLYDYYLK